MNSKYMLAVCTLLLISSCAKSPKKITNTNDYDNYLELAENKTLQKAKDENEFWKTKFEAHPEQSSYLVKIAASYSHLFAITGDISYLKEAETDYLKANKNTNYKKSDLLRALAANYITQHKFKEALMIATKAELIGDGLQSTQKMIFDIQLELGNYQLAKAYLEKFENMSDFDYLIRLAKWNDHQGNLEAAIRYLEKAKAIAESSNAISNKLWIYTNLADFYGHEGNIKASYNHYLKALELDPNFQDALNCYAHNLRLTLKNYEKAIEVYTKLISINPKYEYAISRRGICKRELKDYKGYLEDFNKSISANGGKMEIGDYISRSIIKRNLKDYEGVIDDLLEARKLGEIDSFDYEKLGQAFVEIGNLEKSLEFFEKAIQVELAKSDKKNRNVPFPLLYRVYDSYVSTLIKIGEYRKASKLLMEMKSHFPEKIRTIELINILGQKLMTLPDYEINEDERNIIMEYLDSIKI